MLKSLNEQLNFIKKNNDDNRTEERRFNMQFGFERPMCLLMKNPMKSPQDRPTNQENHLMREEKTIKLAKGQIRTVF